MENRYDYTVSVTWAGEKKGVARADGVPQLDVAIPPEFNGHEGIWSPEQLLVGSVASCIMTTFIAIAEASKLEYSAYQSTAHGVLEKTDGGYEFTRITVEATLTVGDDAAVSKAERVLQKAEQNCFISRSVKADVELKPTVMVG